MIGNSHNENQTENQIIFLNLFQIRNFITTLQEVILDDVTTGEFPFKKNAYITNCAKF